MPPWPVEWAVNLESTPLNGPVGLGPASLFQKLIGGPFGFRKFEFRMCAMLRMVNGQCFDETALIGCIHSLVSVMEKNGSICEVTPKMLRRKAEEKLNLESGSLDVEKVYIICALVTIRLKLSRHYFSEALSSFFLPGPHQRHHRRCDEQK